MRPNFPKPKNLKNRARQLGLHLPRPIFDISDPTLLSKFKRIQVCHKHAGKMGVCVQRAGTYSVQVDDKHLLDIPSLHVKISKHDYK